MPSHNTQHVDVKWRVRELITALGGAANIGTLCFKHGLPIPNDATVRAWVSRGRLSSAWIGILIVLAHKEEVVFDPYALVQIVRKDTSR